MTYYEELGVAPNAPASEIRQAYRVLARLVHPDGQADERVRGMAERQMKRLNDLLATLLDPRRRREYDDSLPAPVAAPAANAAAKYRQPGVRFRPRPEPRPRRVPEWAYAVLLNWFWIVPATVILGVGCWYVAADNFPSAAETGRQAATLDRPHPVAQSAPNAPGEKTRRALREASHPPVAAAFVGARQTAPQPSRVEMPASLVVPAREPGRFFPAPAAEPRLATPPAPATADTSTALASARSAPPSLAAPPAPATADDSTALASARSASPSFAGEWLNVPESEAPSTPGVYLPSYVEFLLTEENGELSGNFRARYRIPDRAVSPEVLFRARGKPSAGESARLEWTSVDGARGEVEMQLHGSNGMSVTWWTTEFGRHPSLTSGSAKLLRQYSP